MTFEVRCKKCGSDNISIDFVRDIMWCRECKQFEGILDRGADYPKELLEDDENE